MHHIPAPLIEVGRWPCDCNGAQNTSVFIFSRVVWPLLLMRTPICLCVAAASSFLKMSNAIPKPDTVIHIMFMHACFNNLARLCRWVGPLLSIVHTPQPFVWEKDLGCMARRIWDEWPGQEIGECSCEGCGCVNGLLSSLCNWSPFGHKMHFHGC